jgi:biopolymer transport protein ExbD
MRATLIAINLLAFAQIATGQNSPSEVSADVLTIRISADGICHVRKRPMPCADVAQYLSSKHLAPDGHVHMVVDRAAKYEQVAAALKSLQSAGLKVGFVNKDFQ